MGINVINSRITSGVKYDFVRGFFQFPFVFVSALISYIDYFHPISFSKPLLSCAALHFMNKLKNTSAFSWNIKLLFLLLFRLDNNHGKYSLSLYVQSTVSLLSTLANSRFFFCYSVFFPKIL